MRVGRKTVGIPTPCPQGLWHFVVLEKINCPPHRLGIRCWMGVCLASRLPAEQLRRPALGCLSLGSLPSTPQTEGLQRRPVFSPFSLPSVSHKANRALAAKRAFRASDCGSICKATYQRGESFCSSFPRSTQSLRLPGNLARKHVANSKHVIETSAFVI